MMRTSLFLAMLIFVTGCSSAVAHIDLRDPRLPIEARRWLADAEDEVAIGRARVDDARTELQKLTAYREDLDVQLQEAWSKDKAADDGKTASAAIIGYADSRVELSRMTQESAQMSLELAVLRLDQARAETAIRYDLQIYEMEPITREVEKLKSEVAAIAQKIEDQRAKTEKKADEAWGAYAKYVAAGGTTSALWGI